MNPIVFFCIIGVATAVPVVTRHVGDTEGVGVVGGGSGVEVFTGNVVGTEGLRLVGVRDGVFPANSFLSRDPTFPYLVGQRLVFTEHPFDQEVVKTTGVEYPTVGEVQKVEKVVTDVVRDVPVSQTYSHQNYGAFPYVLPGGHLVRQYPVYPALVKAGVEVGKVGQLGTVAPEVVQKHQTQYFNNLYEKVYGTDLYLHNREYPVSEQIQTPSVRYPVLDKVNEVTKEGPEVLRQVTVPETERYTINEKPVYEAFPYLFPREYTTHHTYPEFYKTFFNRYDTYKYGQGYPVYGNGYYRDLFKAFPYLYNKFPVHDSFYRNVQEYPDYETRYYRDVAKGFPYNYNRFPVQDSFYKYGDEYPFYGKVFSHDHVKAFPYFYNRFPLKDSFYKFVQEHPHYGKVFHHEHKTFPQHYNEFSSTNSFYTYPEELFYYKSKFPYNYDYNVHYLY